MAEHGRGNGLHALAPGTRWAGTLESGADGAVALSVQGAGRQEQVAAGSLGPGAAGCAAVTGIAVLVDRLAGGGAGCAVAAASFEGAEPRGAVPLELLVTSAEVDAERGAATVTVHYGLGPAGLRDAASPPSQHGRVVLRLDLGDEDPAPLLAGGPPVASPKWGQALVERLEASGRLASSGRAFDGAVGLRCDERTLLLRIYRGRVVEHGRRLLGAPTFEIGGAEPAWLDLLGRERNEFMAMATRGAFRVAGNGVEYLRATRMVLDILDAARELPGPRPQEAS